MTGHTYWQSPAIEQRRDQKEEWDGLVQFLNRLDDLKSRLSTARILNDFSAV
jgi:hypothetical protein